MSQDLEHVYAEIKHHLNDVLADETITTIIQMLKEYPKLKELQQSYEKLVPDVKILQSMCDDVGKQNDKFRSRLEFQNKLFTEIQELIKSKVEADVFFLELDLILRKRDNS